MPDLSGTVLEGKYELIKLIGEGGMGAVYEATHRLIGRRLAVKFLHTQYTSNEEVVIRFQREAQAAAAIGHDNIIEVTDMGQTDDGAPFLVMEYLDGMDVRELIAQEGGLSIEQAASIMVQSLSALQAAHHAGIIHRDLKPENIYLISKAERKDYVKLLDFGISKFRSLEAEGAKGLTQTGTVLGTPYYMSPEQARGDQNIGPKSDIYAMGVILFQMLTGRLPFDAPNYNALLIKILTEDPPDPYDLKPDLPGDLVETIKIAMSRDMDARFPTCAEFRERLLPYVPGASTSFQTKMSSESRSAVRAALSSTRTPLEMTKSGGITPTRKSKLPLVAGGVASMAVVAAVVFALFGSKEPEPRFESTHVSITPASPASTAPAGSPAQTDANPSDETAAKPEEVSLKIAATPANARIAIDGVIGVGNPYESTVVKDHSVHKIDISADGYKTLTADVAFDRDHDLSFELEEMPEPVVTKPAKAERSPRKQERRTRSSSDTRRQPSDKAPTPQDTRAKEPKRPGPVDDGSDRRRPRRKIDDDDPWN